MNNETFPITPPPELVREWAKTCSPYDVPADHIATMAARWGANQELEACIQWIQLHFDGMRGWCDDLRAARRPKPPSLKELALTELNLTADPEGAELSRTQVELIRRALEQLDD